MLSALTKALGKDVKTCDLEKIENDCHEKLNISYSSDNRISKISVDVTSRIGKALLQSISSLLYHAIDKNTLKGILGEPTYTLHIPGSSVEQAMLFYNHEDFWLGYKFTKNALATVSLIIPSIIPDVVRYGRIPIRICRA